MSALKPLPEGPILSTVQQARKVKREYEKALLESYTTAMRNVKVDVKKTLTDIATHVATAMVGIEREYHRGWQVRRETPLFKELTDHARRAVQDALPALLAQVRDVRPAGRWVKSARTAYRDSFQRAAYDAIRDAAEADGRLFAENWLKARETETLAAELEESTDG